jgi:cob(I)alamin adenosyltransferase
MGNRLSRIYTRTGDDGTTGLGDGSRVPKDGPRVDAYGTVDELNSLIGAVIAHIDNDDDVRQVLTDVQHDLFDLGGELCMPGMTLVREDYIDRLERELDRYNADLPALKDFILPGGDPAAAHCQVARAVCRRTERVVVALGREEEVAGTAQRYLNRLSDLLFVMARRLARNSGHGETLWDHARRESLKPGEGEA